MSNLNDLGWGERLAIINHFNLSDERVTDVFGVSTDELETARDLAARGSITVDDDIDYSQYEDELNIFSNYTPQVVIPSPEVEKPVTATKPAKEPKKRGRKGTKINDAFTNVPSEPTELEPFASQFNVSIAVLRQSKRFDKTGIPGEIRIRKNKETGIPMIWREVIGD